MSNSSALRTASLHHDGTVFRFHEADGTVIPLNAKGYQTGHGAFAALRRFYALGDSLSEGVWPIRGMAHPDREIAPRDEAFVGRMIDHDLAQDAKAKAAHREALARSEAEFQANEGAASEIFRRGPVNDAQNAPWYVECRTLRGDVVRRHGPFAYGSEGLSNAYHSEMSAAQGHNRSRRHDDESCQRIFRFAAPVPAPAMVPQPCQQAQAQDTRAASPILQRLAEANARLDAWAAKLRDPAKFQPIMRAEYDRAFDARESLAAMAVNADPVAYVRAYPTHAYAYRDRLPADMVARIEAAHTDADMARAVAASFDESKLLIERVRFSVTQGECRLTYDGRVLGQFGDTYTIDGAGHWSGFPDSHWVDAARGLISPAPVAMVAQPVQQAQGRDHRGAVETHPNAEQAAGDLISAAFHPLQIMPGYWGHDDGRRAAVVRDGDGRFYVRHFPAPRPAMVPQPCQQQQAQAMGQAARPVQGSPTTRDDITTRTLTAHCEATRVEHGGSHSTALYHLMCDVLTLCDAKRIDFDALLSEVRSDLVQEAADRS